MSQRTILAWSTYGDAFVRRYHHWEVFNSLEDARSEYNRLITRDDVHFASICEVIESIDHSPDAPSLCYLRQEMQQ